jgi:carboxypeptidase C (cathepsin A)
MGVTTLTWTLRSLLAAATIAIAPVELNAARFTQDVATGPSDTLAVTRHEIVVDGRTLRYTATAGLLPILNDNTAEPVAHMFFVAYTLDRAPGGAVRPLTFIWNGTKVISGKPRAWATLNSLSVWASIPRAASRTITAASTAERTR